MTSSTTTTRHLTVGEIMRPPVTTVERSAHLAAVAYLMKKSHDNALVVITDWASREPVTLICDSDVTQAVADGRDLEQARVSDLRLPEMVALTPDTSVPEAAERMLAARVAFAPVVVDRGLVGLVDMSGICRALLAEGGNPMRAEGRP